MSDGCRAAAARVSCGTAASQLVAKQPGSLLWISAEARHSAERRSKRAGSGLTCASCRRARHERRHPIGATALKQMITVSNGCGAAAACVSCGTAASQLVARPSESLPRCLRRLHTRHRGFASVLAQAGRAAAVAERDVSDGAEAERRLSSRWHRASRLSCCRSMRVLRHYSVTAGSQAA